MARVMSAADHQRITQAIRAAEAGTSGEIYCVVARSSGSYFSHAALIAAAVLVAVGPVAAYVLEQLWISLRLPQFALVQLAALASVLLALWLSPRLRLLVVPRGVQSRAAHANAVRQFLARNVHITEARTGVLLFVSLAERHAEVIADAGINGRVGRHVWNDIVAGLVQAARHGRLADGFVAAAGAAGALLAEHFSAGASDRNELDDHLVEI